MRTGLLFFTVIGSAIVGLVLESETARWLTAGAIAIVAVPLWITMRDRFRKQFWRDVENVIVASDERPAELHPSDQE